MNKILISIILLCCFIYPIYANEKSNLILRSHVPKINTAQKYSNHYHQYGLSLLYPYKLAKTEYYKKVYGNPSINPNFYYNFVIRYKMIEPFIGVKLGYLNTLGETVNFHTKEKFSDGGAKLSLSIVPITTNFGIKLLVFKNYIRIGTHIGYRETYIENVRIEEEEEEEESKEDKNKKYKINSGWNNSIVYGIDLIFNIDKLNTRTQSSIKSMGISSFDIHLFYEITEKLSAKKLWGNRKILNTYFKLDTLGAGISFSI